MYDYSKLPAHMRQGAKDYVENHIPPGGFLTAVICNDLFGALSKADEINRSAIWDWCNFFHNETPYGCWGSPEAFERWISCKEEDAK